MLRKVLLVQSYCLPVWPPILAGRSEILLKLELLILLLLSFRNILSWALGDSDFDPDEPEPEDGDEEEEEVG
jgi:hypothetical protein